MKEMMNTVVESQKKGNEELKNIVLDQGLKEKGAVQSDSGLAAAQVETYLKPPSVHITE